MLAHEKIQPRHAIMYFFDNTILCLRRFAVGVGNFLSSSIKKITRRVGKSKGVAGHEEEKIKYSHSCIKNEPTANIPDIFDSWENLKNIINSPQFNGKADRVNSTSL